MSDTDNREPQTQAAATAQVEGTDAEHVDGATRTQPADEATAQAAASPTFGERCGKRFYAYYPKNRNTVVYACVGLIIALGFLSIGFWRTLLIGLLMTCGIAYGQYRDGNPRIVRFFVKMFSKKD